MDGIAPLRLESEIRRSGSVKKRGKGNESPRVGFEDPRGSWVGNAREEREVAPDDDRVKELKARIQNMRGWKRDMEKSVVWRREEGWAVRNALGLPREDESEGKEVGNRGWGVGGRTWERGCGRCPNQMEWEVLFAERGVEHTG